MKLNLAALCAFVLITCSPTAAQHREPRGRERVPALVVLVDSIRELDAPYVIMRRPGSTPADLIVLRADADASQLSDAVRGLLTARLANGDVPPSAATFRVRPHQRGGAAAQPALPWAPRVINDVRRAPVREISGIGRVRAVQIWLPRQGTGRAKPRT